MPKHNKSLKAYSIASVQEIQGVEKEDAIKKFALYESHLD